MKDYWIVRHMLDVGFKYILCTLPDEDKEKYDFDEDFITVVVGVYEEKLLDIDGNTWENLVAISPCGDAIEYDEYVSLCGLYNKDLGE